MVRHLARHSASATLRERVPAWRGVKDRAFDASEEAKDTKDTMDTKEMYDLPFVSSVFFVSLAVSLYTELQRLGDVLRPDLILGRQVRDGARHFPHAIEAARAERHPADGRVQ
jgi:hypothetical protein